MSQTAAEQLEFWDVASGQLVRTMAVELSPGLHVVTEPNLVPEDALPKWGIAEFVRNPDNSYKLVARTNGNQIKLTMDIGQQLGIRGPGRSIYETIKRLCWAGFIRHRQWTKDSYYLDLHSLYKFMRRIENPGFWTPERVARLRDAREGPLPDPDNEHWNPEKL